MTAPVARQKRDVLAGKLPDHILIRRPSPRTVQQHLLVRFESRHGIQPAAADNADRRFHKMLDLIPESAPAKLRPSTTDAQTHKDVRRRPASDRSTAARLSTSAAPPPRSNPAPGSPRDAIP